MKAVAGTPFDEVFESQPLSDGITPPGVLAVSIRDGTERKGIRMQKTAIVICAVLASIAMADDSPAAKIKRLASVTWDPQTGKLSWVVQTGTEGTGSFASSSEEHFEIAPKEATMTSAGQQRGFTNQEAEWLGNLLHALSTYCVASTIWWYRAENPPSPDGKPTTAPPAAPDAPKPGGTPDTTPHKVTEPQNLKMPLTSPHIQQVAP